MSRTASHRRNHAFSNLDTQSCAVDSAFTA